MDQKAMALALREVAGVIPEPSRGLPDAVFGFALKIVPMINVDLLVRDIRGRHLLAWRSDEYGCGWHVPGGIVRFNETLEQRITGVAATELSARVRHAPGPADIKQIFHARGHFVSLLYLCELDGPVDSAAPWHDGVQPPQHGQIAWHAGMPAEIYAVHRVYHDWLEGTRADRSPEETQ